MNQISIGIDPGKDGGIALITNDRPETHPYSDDYLIYIMRSYRDFDRYYTLGEGSPGDALVLPTGYTMVKTEALPSAWFYANRETLYRGAEIIIKCHVDVDVNQIS